MSILLPLIVASAPIPTELPRAAKLEDIVARNVAVASGLSVPFNWTEDALEQAVIIADVSEVEDGAEVDAIH